MLAHAVSRGGGEGGFYRLQPTKVKGLGGYPCKPLQSLGASGWKGGGVKEVSWFRVQGSGFIVQVSGVKGHGLWSMVHGSWFKIQGSGFMVHGSGFMVQGSGV